MILIKVHPIKRDEEIFEVMDDFMRDFTGEDGETEAVRHIEALVSYPDLDKFPTDYATYEERPELEVKL